MVGLAVSLVVVVGLVTAGCAALPRNEAPASCEFPPGTALAFAGEASLDDAGLAPEDAPGRDRRGDLYVTVEVIKVAYDRGSDRRRFCLVYPSETDQPSGDMAFGPVPHDWAPPS
jgi:hypothetical protein